ncbi:MAG: hypothetical protein ABR568_13970 [Pyrinomonadaceae bacterium]
MSGRNNGTRKGISPDDPLGLNKYLDEPDSPTIVAATRDDYDVLLDDLLSGLVVPLCVRRYIPTQRDHETSWCGRDVSTEPVIENVEAALLLNSLGTASCSKCMEAIKESVNDSNDGLPSQ